MWTKERLGNRWFGFTAEALTTMMGQVGLTDVVVLPVLEEQDG
jgi:hypothetical protein